jgi:hypothetical protein
MADLYSIPGITDAEADNLRTAGYLTTDALWAKLAEDKKGTLEDLASAVGFSATRLAALLAADVGRKASAVEGGGIRRHWLDIMVAAAVILLVWALFVWRGAVPDKAGLTLLRVPLKQLPADGTRKTPYPATLVASPHAAAEPELEEVTVVEIQKEKDPAATLELKPEQVRHIGRLLGTADFYLAQPVP